MYIRCTVAKLSLYHERIESIFTRFTEDPEYKDTFTFASFVSFYFRLFSLANVHGPLVDRFRGIRLLLHATALI